MAVRHQVYLERLKAQTVIDVNAALADVGAAVTDVLSALRRPLSDLTRRQLQTLLRQLRDAQAELLQEGLAALTKDAKTLAAYEASFEARALQQILKPIRIALPSAEAAYAAALERPLSATGQLLDNWYGEWQTTQVAAVNRLVTKAWADGWTVDQTVQAIRGTRAAGYTDGVLAATRRATQAVVRTAIQHIASTARMRTWAQNADIVKQYRWVATLDSRTTIICQSLDGRIFELGKGPVPPAHVNCRSTTAAVISRALYSQMNVPPDDQPTYYEWLKRQPAAFQNDALGATRAQLFRKGGLSADEFARLQLGRDFHPLTLDEMRRKEPSVFEHAGL